MKKTDYLDLKMMNCAGCGCELLAKGQTPASSLKNLPPLVCGHIAERPYCSCCLNANQPRKMIDRKEFGKRPNEREE